MSSDGVNRVRNLARVPLDEQSSKVELALEQLRVACGGAVGCAKLHVPPWKAPVSSVSTHEGIAKESRVQPRIETVIRVRLKHRGRVQCTRSDGLSMACLAEKAPIAKRVLGARCSTSQVCELRRALFHDAGINLK